MNIAAVGLALAAMTTALFMLGWVESTNWALVVGLPTLAVGSVWAGLLRLREKVGAIPLGWFLSIPLAAINAGIACGLLFVVHGDPHVGAFFGGLILGATFGVILWAPGLACALALFGFPIQHARKLAARGLAGEDHGERFVGTVAVIVAGLAAILVHGAKAQSGVIDAYAFAALAACLGSAATFIARRRELARRRFIARVEADRVPGLRIEPRTLGKMVVRIDPHIETYRIAPQPDEELIELDDDGNALRAMR